jgi:tetratricopeptide (TPR) repeat protein
VTGLAARRNFSLSSALPWAFLFGGFALYAAGTAPGLSILDAGEFLGVASTLGVAHPTGYPLYALLGQLATFFPWGEKAYLINLVSAAAAAGAAFFVALAARELARILNMTETATTLAVAAAGLLVLAGRTLWSVATMAEVYGLNALFWGALLWAALRLRRRGTARELYVLALVAGLSLANHVTIILFFPALIFIGWPGKERAKALTRALPLAAALFLMGISVNLYTPLRAAQKPIFNWNDPSTARSLYAHLAGFQYRGLLFAGRLAAFKTVLGKFWESGRYGFWAVLFAAPALVWLFRRPYRGVGLGVTLYFLGYLVYCGLYDIMDIYYYFVPWHLAVVFLAAAGVGEVADVLARRGRRFRLVGGVVLSALIFAGFFGAFASNWRYGDRAGFTFAETYGRRLLAALPPRALFLSSGDTNGNLTWYNLYVRGRRPDVVVADQVRLVSGGYVTSLARRHPDLILPEEAEIGFLAATAFAHGAFGQANFVMRKSDDFILPELLDLIITRNVSRRIFWGLGDPGARLPAYLLPYDLTLEVVLEEPPRAELERRAGDAVAALTGVMARVRREGPAQLRDAPFREHASLYYFSLADQLAGWGLYGPEATLLESYVRLFPEDAHGYESLGSVYATAGRPGEAAENYRRALALTPGDAALRVRLVKALAAAGRGDEAAAAAGAEGGAPGEADYLRAVAFREAGRIDEALAAFAAAAPHFEDDADFWLEYGLARDAGGDYEGATRAFDRALELEPGRAWLYTARGVENLKLGDADGAAADFKAALKLNPRDAQAHYNLACLYARAGRNGEALQELEAALELEPAHYAAVAREDEDLAHLRDQPAFERLMAAAGGAPKE